MTDLQGSIVVIVGDNPQELAKSLAEEVSKTGQKTQVLAITSYGIKQVAYLVVSVQKLKKEK